MDAISGVEKFNVVSMLTTVVVGVILVPLMAYNIGYRILFRRYAGHIHQIHIPPQMLNDVPALVGIYMRLDFVELLQQQFLFSMNEMHQLITILITRGHDATEINLRRLCQLVTNLVDTREFALTKDTLTILDECYTEYNDSPTIHQFRMVYNRRKGTGIVVLKDQVLNLNQDNQLLNQDNQQLNVSIQDLNIDNRQLHNNVQLLHTDLQHAHNDLQHAQGNVQQLHHDNQHITHHVQNLNQDVQNLNQDNQHLNQENQQLRGELRTKTRMVERSSEGLQLASAEVRSCERKLVRKSVKLTMEKQANEAERQAKEHERQAKEEERQAKEKERHEKELALALCVNARADTTRALQQRNYQSTLFNMAMQQIGGDQERVYNIQQAHDEVEQERDELEHEVGDLERSADEVVNRCLQQIDTIQKLHEEKVKLHEEKVQKDNVIVEKDTIISEKDGHIEQLYKANLRAQSEKLEMNSYIQKLLEQNEEMKLKFESCSKQMS